MIIPFYNKYRYIDFKDFDSYKDIKYRYSCRTKKYNSRNKKGISKKK